MEMADAIVITKADGENSKWANQAKADFTYALHLFPENESHWKPTVITSSALEKKGIAETWDIIRQYVDFTQNNHFFEHQRVQQNLTWFRESIQHLLIQQLSESDSIKSKMKTLENKIIDKTVLPSRAAKEIVNDFLSFSPSR